MLGEEVGLVGVSCKKLDFGNQALIVLARVDYGLSSHTHDSYSSTISVMRTGYCGEPYHVMNNMLISKAHQPKERQRILTTLSLDERVDNNLEHHIVFHEQLSNKSCSLRTFKMNR